MCTETACQICQKYLQNFQRCKNNYLWKKLHKLEMLLELIALKYVLPKAFSNE